MMNLPERTGVPSSFGVAVFCGAREAVPDAWLQTARSVGTQIAERGFRVVYGGGGLGLMGHLATATLEHGGSITGVIPHSMVDKELAHPGVEDMRRVETMHERKALMASLADGFLALPGGVGTLDELFEAITWRQLNIHRCPIAILNTDGFFDPIWSFLETASRQDFVPKSTMQCIRCSDDPGELLDWLSADR